MSRISTGRFAGATTITAVLALMLIVPTVLHIADPAFGQATGSSNGYQKTVTVNSGTQLNANTSVGSVSANQTVGVKFQKNNTDKPLELTTLRTLTGVAREEALKTVLSQPKVTSVNIKSTRDAPNVNIVVKEYVPTDAAVTGVTKAPPGSGVTSVILKAKTAEGKTEDFRALKIIEIHAEGLEGGGVESADIGFTVTPEELEAMGLTPDDIQLMHHVDGEWVPLPTTYLGLVDGEHQFTAVTPSFSYFAVASKEPIQASSAATPEGKSALGWTAFFLAGLVVVAVAVVVVMKRQGKF